MCVQKPDRKLNATHMLQNGFGHKKKLLAVKTRSLSDSESRCSASAIVGRTRSPQLHSAVEDVLDSYEEDEIPVFLDDELFDDDIPEYEYIQADADRQSVRASSSRWTTADTNQTQSSLTSWGDDDFDRQASKRVAELFAEIDAFLYDDASLKINKTLKDELNDWKKKFPHFRIVGKQLSAEHEASVPQRPSSVLLTKSATSRPAIRNRPRITKSPAERKSSGKALDNESRLSIIGQRVSPTFTAKRSQRISSLDQKEEMPVFADHQSLHSHPVASQTAMIRQFPNAANNQEYEELIAFDKPQRSKSSGSNTTERNQSRGRVCDSSDSRYRRSSQSVLPSIVPATSQREQVLDALFEKAWSEVLPVVAPLVEICAAKLEESEKLPKIANTSPTRSEVRKFSCQSHGAHESHVAGASQSSKDKHTNGNLSPICGGLSVSQFTPTAFVDEESGFQTISTPKPKAALPPNCNHVQKSVAKDLTLDDFHSLPGFADVIHRKLSDRSVIVTTITDDAPVVKPSATEDTAVGSKVAASSRMVSAACHRFNPRLKPLLKRTNNSRHALTKIADRSTVNFNQQSVGSGSAAHARLPPIIHEADVMPNLPSKSRPLIDRSSSSVSLHSGRQRSRSTVTPRLSQTAENHKYDRQARNQKHLRFATANASIGETEEGLLHHLTVGIAGIGIAPRSADHYKNPAASKTSQFKRTRSFQGHSAGARSYNLSSAKTVSFASSKTTQTANNSKSVSMSNITSAPLFSSSTTTFASSRGTQPAQSEAAVQAHRRTTTHHGILRKKSSSPTNGLCKPTISTQAKTVQFLKSASPIRKSRTVPPFKV